MKIKAVKNFSGMVSMSAGEERDVRDVIAKDLIRSGYAQPARKAAEAIPESEHGQKKAKKDK